MKLYFRNSRAKFRPIANIDGRKPDKEIAKQIVAKINEFCDERNFKIYYTRIWHEECKGKQMTKFDVATRNFSILKKLFRSQHFKETNK